MDHPFFERVFDNFDLPRPKFEFDSQIAPLSITDLLYPKEFRGSQNDRFVLLIHGVGNGMNRLGYILFIEPLGQLNVDVGADTAASKLANDSNISVGDQNSLAMQVNECGKSESNDINPANFIAQLNHFSDIEGIGKNQRETNHQILHKALQTKTDSQSDNGCTGKISRQRNFKFVQYHADSHKINRKRHRVYQKGNDGGNSGISSGQVQLGGFFGIQFHGQQVSAEPADEFDGKMCGHG